MKKLSSNEIRTIFLDYFQKYNHQIVPSSSLIPANDPTLLFTNAGMVQFKDVFLGVEQRAYTRAVSSQRCVRAGGKHNDLENVGFTKRHHTFFEMLGNFSFGDYFKKEAIQFAWNFLTKTLEIPVERLWVTVHHSDQESEAIWLNEIGVDPKHFSKQGDKDNFWSMGEVGPCGPCTEIFYDHGSSVAGGPPGSANEDGDRYVEIWNIVFMQFNRDIEGKLMPLPSPCVDTGMGLERISTVLQGVHDNYDIDLFQHLLTALSKIIGCDDFQNKSMRVIVDHIRAVSFLIIDGITPSNEGRGYVLRRIIRRAVRHGYKLGMKDVFLYQLVPALASIMGDAYPELKAKQDLIMEVIVEEEQQFSTTLNKGMKVFEQIAKSLQPQQIITGHDVFLLYDTYGFPPDLTADIARERDLKVDFQGFKKEMNQQRMKSQQATQFKASQIQQLHIEGKTEFTGYNKFIDTATVTTLLVDYKPVHQIATNEEGIVVLDRTPFYAESGGQVGDKGYLYFDSGCFHVLDTQKHGDCYLHRGIVEQGELKLKMSVRAEVDSSRQATKLNHSATHLLHEALRRVLGQHVTQKGSLVNPERLRFDFSHNKPLTSQQIQEVERLVNQQIRANLATTMSTGDLEAAKAAGALALFDEKYGDVLRIIKMGKFSTEVCGGTHVSHTGEIGCFKIITESAVAAGIRRIEAVTGEVAIEWIEQCQTKLTQLTQLLKVNSEELINKINQLIEDNRSLQKQVMQAQQLSANQQTADLIKAAIKIEDIEVIAIQLKNVGRDTLRTTLDQLKNKMDRAAIVLATVKDNKVILVSGVTKNCLSYFNATELLNYVAIQVDGKGGGRPDMAQGGGDRPQDLQIALDSVPQWVKERVLR